MKSYRINNQLSTADLNRDGFPLFVFFIGLWLAPESSRQCNSWSGIIRVIIFGCRIKFRCSCYTCKSVKRWISKPPKATKGEQTTERRETRVLQVGEYITNIHSLDSTFPHPGVPLFDNLRLFSLVRLAHNDIFHCFCSHTTRPLLLARCPVHVWYRLWFIYQPVEVYLVSRNEGGGE